MLLIRAVGPLPSAPIPSILHIICNVRIKRCAPAPGPWGPGGPSSSSLGVGWCWWRVPPRGRGCCAWSLGGVCFPAVLPVASRVARFVCRPSPFAGWLSVLAWLRLSAGSFVVRPSPFACRLCGWSSVVRPLNPNLNHSNPLQLSTDPTELDHYTTQQGV